MGYMNFFPLEPQDPKKEHNDNTINKEKEQSQNTLNELINTLKDQQNKTTEIIEIEPLPIKND